MMRMRLRALGRHPWLVGSFVLAISATLFFAVRLVVFTIYWSDPAHRDQAVQGWMTPGYVAHSWDIPRDAMQAALADLTRPGERKSLERIAAENDVPLAVLIDRIEAAIALQRAGG